MDDAVDAALALDATAPVDVPLPTFSVLARLRSTAPDAAAAVADVIAQVSPAAGLFEDVVVERQEADGSFWVVVRFVTVSVDAHTAVAGVYETLTNQGVAVDEVWAPPT